jgi:hypothetical protein
MSPLAAPLPRRTLSRPEKPRTCPQDLAPREPWPRRAPAIGNAPRGQSLAVRRPLCRLMHRGSQASAARGWRRRSAADSPPCVGAKGLEPATSGVTGRHGATGYNRLRPELHATAGLSSSSRPVVTGYDRLRPGTACVEGVWSTRCLLRQRTMFDLRWGGPVGAIAPNVRLRQRLEDAAAVEDRPPHRRDEHPEHHEQDRDDEDPRRDRRDDRAD